VKVLLFDNYDSFTYNLADYLITEGAELLVIRNDEYPPEEWDNMSFDAAVLSPGPSSPDKAGHLMKFIANWHTRKPLLGVCLGFQALGVHFGAELQHAAQPVHGKTSRIHCQEHPMYEGIPLSHDVCRYHSLRLGPIPDDLQTTAETAEGIPMAFAHRKLPVWAVQYHPEAILTEHGHAYIRNWIKMAGNRS
jgi:anthranilate synthase component 2